MGVFLFHKILDHPGVHDFVQKVLAAGRSKAFHSTEQCIEGNCSGKVLDIGCGTGRYAHLFHRDYFGIDINARYLEKRAEEGRHFVPCDATKLPFKSRTFDSVFSVGFFHHVNVSLSKNVYKEIVRVCRPGARILIIDAFYPDRRLDMPGYWLMKMDRGRYARYSDAYTHELREYFNVVDSHPIAHSYPYNLYYFILQPR